MRLFLATTFPVEVLRLVNARVDPLKPRLPPASWVRQEAQHLTLAFLGEHPESLLARLEGALAGALTTVPAFEARLRGCGFFPNSRHARVGWIGLEPESAFMRAAQAVRDVVTDSGVKLDGADFKAHLTLMRIREPWPPASIDLFNRSFHDYESVTFPVNAVTLFSSKLDPKGAMHTPLRAWPLATE
ncbi:MAG: RNA 2',3'-cyclic phosphodiesterase [Acidobacteriota bacterium]